MTTVEKEWGIGAGSMLRLKHRWGKHYSQKNHISKQNLRDNVARFKKELKMNFGSEESRIEIEEGRTWTTPTSGQPK